MLIPANDKVLIATVTAIRLKMFCILIEILRVALA